MASRGQPSPYTRQLATRICELIATTPRGLGFILRTNPDLPRISTVLNWLADPAKKDFLDSYLRAREAQADLIFDECLEIADESAKDAERGDNGKETQHATEQVARSKLRVDTRLRMAGKLAPKKYGEKYEVEQTVVERRAVPSRDELATRQAAWDRQFAPADEHTVN